MIAQQYGNGPSNPYPDAADTRDRVKGWLSEPGAFVAKYERYVMGNQPPRHA